MRTRTPVALRFLLTVTFTAAAVAQPWAVRSERDVLTALNAAYVKDSKLAPSGDLYLTTEEPDLPLDKAFGDPSVRNIKVARLDPQGNRRFVVRLGGVLLSSILLDPAGDVYLSGRTSTFGFPATPGAYRAVAPPTPEADFVCKLRGVDGTPVYCTYLEGDARVLAIDANGAVIFRSIAEVGHDFSVSVLDPTGSKLTSTTSFGDASRTFLYLAAVDRDGSVYLAGWTGDQSKPKPFLAKLDAQTRKVTRSIEPVMTSVVSLAILPATGPLLTGSANPLGTASRVVQYSRADLAMVYERELPVPPSLSALIADDDVVLTGITSSISLPLLKNAYPCRRVLSPQDFYSSFLIRLSSAGELLQTTWLGTNSIGTAIPIPGAGIAAAMPIPGSVAPLLTIRMFSLGPSDDAPASTKLGCFVDAAVYQISAWSSVVSPGLIFNFTGENIGPAERVDAQPDASYPKVLAGTALTFDGVPAPILSISQNSLQAVAPFSLEGKQSAELCITTAGDQTRDCTTVTVRAGITALYSTSTNHVAALNQDGSVNSADHPAPVGSVVALFFTGLGPLSPPVADGTIVGDTLLPALVNQITVTILPICPLAGKLPVCPFIPVTEVLYAGPAPFSVAGFYQVNIRIPALSDLRSPGSRSLRVILSSPDGPLPYASFSASIDLAPAP
jgi:uncharacterized protein (TIGR03437 family)